MQIQEGMIDGWSWFCFKWTFSQFYEKTQFLSSISSLSQMVTNLTNLRFNEVESNTKNWCTRRDARNDAKMRCT